MFQPTHAARALAGLVLLALATSAQAPVQPLRVFLRGGPKTHGPGEHDHPRFVADWRALLEARGAVVDGALSFPTREQLERTDVLVLYAAEGGSIHGAERADLEAYLARGGGIAVLHDALCGDDPHWFKTVVGGAWEHGHAQWHTGAIGLYFDAGEHPITRGLANFDLTDEIYHQLHLVPEARVLASSFHTPFDVTPQLWVYEPGPYRAFVSVQGHYAKTFEHAAWRALLLRGIAWAGGREADLFLSPAEVAALRYPPGGPAAPARAAEGFALHPDFELELVAAEPDVVNPISIDWDPDGRAWLALTPGYPYKEEFAGTPAHDRIVVLEDDGRARVFFEGLDLVTSLVLHGDGAIVSAAPELLWLRDTDGDGAADERVVLFSGFGYGDTHATVNNLRWGLDGWIYATQGYSGNASRHVLGRDGTDFGHVPNGLFRFRPDGSAIEVVASYGSNTWGLDFAPDGELFFTMANGSHARHVVLPEAVLADARVGGVNSWKHLPDHREVRPLVQRERSPYRQIDFVGGFTAAAGSLVYDGGAWPDELGASHFVCEPTVNLVHRDALAPGGVSFTASKPREAEFLASRDLWFRPVHLRTGPDGALYVLDFCNQAAIHNDTRGPQHGPTNAAVRPDRDRQHGRVWRVQHAHARAARPPELGDAESGALVPLLAHPNSWWRETAQRLLRERQDTTVVPALVDLVRLSRSYRARIHALWLLETLPLDRGHLEGVLARGLDDDDARVRKNAAHIAGLHPDARGLTPRLVELALEERDARARLAALVALGGRPLAEDAVAALADAYAALDDDWTRSALVRALLASAEGALAHAAAGEHGRVLAVELARHVARRGDASEVAGAARALARAAREPGSGVAVAPALAALSALPERFEPKGSAAERRALAALLGHEALDIAVAALPLAARVGIDGAELQGLGERLLERLQDEQSTYADCVASLRPLLSVGALRGQAIAAAAPLLAPHVPLDVQLEVVAALGAARDGAAGEALAAALPRLSSRAREAAFDALLARPAWVAPLLLQLERGELLPRDLGPRRLHRLRNHPDATVARRAAVVLEALAPAGRESLDELVAELLPVVSTPGDVARGRALFAENCGICHVHDGAGAAIGPELTGMGAHGVEALLPLILDPNREVDPAYLEYVIETAGGQLVTGVIARETADAVVLRNTGGDVEVARADIEDLRTSGLSLMPTGLETLGAAELRDVLAYLTDGYRGFRVVDLADVANASSARGMYDPAHHKAAYRFARRGTVELDGTPFQLPDPERARDGHDVLVLKGGPRGWRSKDQLAQRVELPIGAAVERVHVLGGVAGWGHPWGSLRDQPAVRWTWVFGDGSESSVVLRDGQHFADWIGRFDVPRSSFVDGLLVPGSPGQVRRFALEPPRDAGPARVVERVVLESFDNHVAPTFLALTLELPGAAARAEPAAAPKLEAARMILGGGSSHDFGRWFRDADAATLKNGAHYTERPDDVLAARGALRVLELCTNQPLSGEVRAAIVEHVATGGGLLALHAGTWHNWPDWAAYYRYLVRAGARSHEPLRAFAVEVTRPDHPVMAGVPARFELTDELYRVERHPPRAAIEVLAEGVSKQTGERYPVVWTTAVGAGRVLAVTLGHDGQAHQHPAFQRLLANGWAWLER